MIDVVRGKRYRITETYGEHDLTVVYAGRVEAVYERTVQFADGALAWGQDDGDIKVTIEALRDPLPTGVGSVILYKQMLMMRRAASAGTNWVTDSGYLADDPADPTWVLLFDATPQ